MSTLDIAWLAGLLEGEGCFWVGQKTSKGKKYPAIVIQLCMTDRDPVERTARMFKNTVLTQKNRTKAGKAIYRTAAYGANAIAWMQTVYVLLSPRRQEKIRECLAVWRAMPGRGKHYAFTKNIGRVENFAHGR